MSVRPSGVNAIAVGALTAVTRLSEKPTGNACPRAAGTNAVSAVSVATTSGVTRFFIVVIYADGMKTARKIPA